MARQPKRKPAPKRRSASAQAGSGKLLLWAIGFAGILFVFPGVVMVVLVGMAPTLVAAIIDRTPKKYAAFTVGGMNLSGVFPSLMDLFSGAYNIPAAVNILTDPFKLIIMYGAALGGWLLYQSIPPVVAAMIAVSAQHRIAQLRTRQRELIREWGEAIALAPEDDAA